ncbi:MAG: antibiotic biosynthesis monooxygenase [Acidobacteriota bacterium]
MFDPSFRMVVTFRIQPGKTAAAQEIAREIAGLVEREEPRTFNYEWHVSADGSEFVLTEHYPDSDAYVPHLPRVGPLLDRLLAIARIDGMLVLGDVDERVHAALAPLGARFLPRFSGFTR